MRSIPLLVAALALSSPALAAEPPRSLPRSLRLDVQRAAGVEACPADEVLHDVIAARMSWDPIVATADTMLTVALSRRGRAYAGRVAIVDGKGRTLWSRPTITLDDCASVIEGLGFAAAIKMDPAGPPAGQRAARVVAPVVAPVVVHDPLPVAVAPVALPVPVARPADPVVHVTHAPIEASRRWHVGAQGGVAFGVSPAPVAAIVGLDVGARWSAFSVGVEGRASLPASSVLPSGQSLTTAMYGGAAVGCAHWRILAGCGILDVAALVATSSAAHPVSGVAVTVRTGLRGGVEVPIGGTFAARLAGEALLPIQRGAAAIDKRIVWTAPIVAGDLQAGVSVSF